MFNQKRVNKLEGIIMGLEMELRFRRQDSHKIQNELNSVQNDLWTLRRSLGLTHEQEEKTERRFVKPPKENK